MDIADNKLQLSDFNYQKKSDSLKKNLLGIITDIQLGETYLFLFVNGFLLPTYEKKYINYCSCSREILDFLKERDLIFETDAFIPDLSSINNLQLLANTILDYKQMDCLSKESYPSEVYEKLDSALQIVNRYSFLILNEPFYNLKNEALFNMINFIRELRRLGKIILLSNQKVQVINKFTNTDHSLKTGKIITVPCMIIN
jgi:hypothetical protein